MPSAPFTHPVLLVIRDGWGCNHDRSQDAYNAVRLARTPVDDALRAAWPVTELAACGLDVGVPAGVMGNSEVGHQNIGAGRIVDQEIVRLNKLIVEGGLATNPVWQAIVRRVREGGGRLHLFGLVSDAGVHALLEHLYGVLRQARADGLERVFVHAFTDGRDTPPRSGLGFIRELEAQCRQIGTGRIASVCGRFWSMDRDNRWERVSRAYRMLTGQAADHQAATAAEAVQHYYDHPLDASRQGDEFVVPTWMADAGGPIGPVEDGDAVLFVNFRGDRPRELTRAFVDAEFTAFERGPRLDLHYATMTEYQQGLPVEVVLPKPPKMAGILGMVVSARGIPQFRCAETEKYPHVTFFFNDYREEPFPGEERVLLSSPKVSTYDQQPEMSAAGVTEAAREAILSRRFGLLVVNYANGDMVGHTGSLPAAIRAVETVDAGVGVLLEALRATGGRAVITADHGNCEQMWDPVSAGPHTAHTLNPVEAFVVGPGCAGRSLRPGGRLGDLAPTILDLMGLPPPPEMTGRSLLA